MNNYSRNWQYSMTKEVLGVHEVVYPYDWSLDVEQSDDFVVWEEELKIKGDSNEK